MKTLLLIITIALIGCSDLTDPTSEPSATMTIEEMGVRVSSMECSITQGVVNLLGICLLGVL